MPSRKCNRFQDETWLDLLVVSFFMLDAVFAPIKTSDVMNLRFICNLHGNIHSSLEIEKWKTNIG